MNNFKLSAMLPFLSLVFTSCVLTMHAAAAETKREFPDEAYFNKPDDPTQKKMDELVGKPMPPLQVANWINGEVKPADMKDKVVVIDIFATWCAPCVASIPENNALAAKYKSQGLIYLSVCTSDEGQDKLADLVKTKKIEYPVAKDPELKTSEAYRAEIMPTYVVVDRKGIVRAIGLTPKGVETAVKALLAEK